MKRCRVVIFGCNRVSLEVARNLRERDWDLLLVSADPDCLKSAEAEGLAVREIDYTNDEELKALGLGDDVGVVFTLFEKDSRNVFLVISIRYLAPDIRIISLCQSEHSESKLRAAGVNKVIDPYKISGQRIHNMIKRPLVTEVIERTIFGDRRLGVMELEVEKGSFLDGRSLGELNLSIHYNLVLLGVVDRESGNEFIFATGNVDHRLGPEDVLVVIGPTREIERFEQDSRAKKTPSAGGEGEEGRP